MLIFKTIEGKIWALSETCSWLHAAVPATLDGRQGTWKDHGAMPTVKPFLARLIRALADRQGWSIEQVAQLAGLAAGNLRTRVREGSVLEERSFLKVLEAFGWDERRLLSDDALALLEGRQPEPEVARLAARVAELEVMIAEIRRVIKDERDG